MSATMALGAAVALSAVLTILGEYRGPRRLVYVFKPLTTALVLAAALVAELPPSPFYRWAIVAGLALSLAGDVFLMLPRDRFVAGLASFFAAHLCYLAAFWSDGGVRAALVPLLPFALACAVLLRVLWPRLGSLKGPVAAYALVLAVMAWQATARALGMGAPGAGEAAAGAALFVVSDATLAVNRFAYPFRAAQAAVLATYFAAQWLIALSV